jgi:hypothetical protein
MAWAWGSVSIGALFWGNMEGHSFHRAFEIKRYIKREVTTPCKWVSVCIGGPVGELEVFCLPGLFERKG